MEEASRWRERLGELSVPTLVVHGTEDPVVPYGNGLALAREIPGARAAHAGADRPRAAAGGLGRRRPRHPGAHLPPLTIRTRVQLTPGARCRRSCSRLEEPRLVPEDHRLDPVSQPELPKHVPDVRLHGPLAHDELTGDLGVGEATCHQAEHLPLAGRQLVHLGLEILPGAGKRGELADHRRP